jgi:hypothetical protein
MGISLTPTFRWVHPQNLIIERFSTQEFVNEFLSREAAGLDCATT